MEDFNRPLERRKLFLSFLKQWVYWVIAWWLLQYIWPDGGLKTVWEIFFIATWMAIFITVMFQWRRIKRLLVKKKQ